MKQDSQYYQLLNDSLVYEGNAVSTKLNVALIN